MKDCQHHTIDVWQRILSGRQLTLSPLASKMAVRLKNRCQGACVRKPLSPWNVSNPHGSWSLKWFMKWRLRVQRWTQIWMGLKQKVLVLLVDIPALRWYGLVNL
jgi:hypothetical protein